MLCRDDIYYLHINGIAIAHSQATFPLKKAIELAAKPFKPARQPRILIDQIQLGTALASAVNELPQKGAVFIVAEPNDELITWHPKSLAELHPGLLDDSRILHKKTDAMSYARQQDSTLSLIISACQGSPSEVRDLHPLLTIAGLEVAYQALKPGGLLVVQSNTRDHRFSRQIKKIGFDLVEEAYPPSSNSRTKRLHPVWYARKGQYRTHSQ